MRDYFILTRKFTLGKEERLKSRKQTEKLFSKGKKFSVDFLRVHWLELNDGGEPGLLFGAGVSVRLFKKAVDRNRIKRLLRETYRVQKSSLLEEAIKNKWRLAVFFIYNGKELPAYTDVFLSMGKALKKLENNTR